MSAGKPYTGGAWSIGSCNPYRPPHALSAFEAAARAKDIREHWLPIAEARAAAGRRWYPEMVAWYQRELAALDAVIALATARKHAKSRRKQAKGA